MNSVAIDLSMKEKWADQENNKSRIFVCASISVPWFCNIFHCSLSNMPLSTQIIHAYLLKWIELNSATGMSILYGIINQWNIHWHHSIEVHTQSIAHLFLGVPVGVAYACHQALPKLNRRCVIWISSVYSVSGFCRNLKALGSGRSVLVALCRERQETGHRITC